MCIRTKFPEKLIIFGNGFSLWLGLPTKYYNYKKFLLRNKEKYQNALMLFDVITNYCNDADWNRLEDDMYNFAINKNKIELDNPNIDIEKANIEKNDSLNEWINEIRVQYKDELTNLYNLLYKMSKTNLYNFWTFNYIIDFMSPKLGKMIVANARGNGKVRSVTQLHYRSHTDGTSEILFGGDWTEIRKKYPSQLTLHSESLIRFCSKFYGKNLCTDFKIETKNKAMSFGPDFPKNPTLDAYNDMLGLAHANWTQERGFSSNFINELDFIGFSLGVQDSNYFRSKDEKNPIRWIYRNNGLVKISYFNKNEIIPLSEKWESYLNNDEKKKHLHKIIKDDDLIKEVFSNFYDKLLKIKNQTQNKSKKLFPL
mgnify:CR=1 FL=1